MGEDLLVAVRLAHVAGERYAIPRRDGVSQVPRKETGIDHGLPPKCRNSKSMPPGARQCRPFRKRHQLHCLKPRTLRLLAHNTNSMDVQLCGNTTTDAPSVMRGRVQWTLACADDDTDATLPAACDSSHIVPVGDARGTTMTLWMYSEAPHASRRSRQERRCWTSAVENLSFNNGPHSVIKLCAPAHTVRSDTHTHSFRSTARAVAWSVRNQRSRRSRIVSS